MDEENNDEDYISPNLSFNQANSENMQAHLHGDDPYDYHSMLLEIFMISCKGSVDFNINLTRVQPIFSANYIFDLLMQ